jgi:hypothetical protein
MNKLRNLDNILFITSISIIIILLLLMIIFHKKTNTIFQSIIIWLIIYIISYWCSNSIHISIFISIILILLLAFIRCKNNVLENFDDKKDDTDDTDKKDDTDDTDKKDDTDDKKDDNDDKKDDTGESNDFAKTALKDLKKNHTDVVKNIKEKTDLISSDFGLSEINKMLEGIQDSNEDKNTKKINKMDDIKNASPHVAQRETFRLINTVKELDTTLKALSPALTQGKNVIDMMKKLNL